MRRASLVAAVLFLITVHFAAADQPPPEEAEHRVLFEKGLDAGRKLVVTRGSDHDGSEFGLKNGLDGTLQPGPAGKLNVYEVRVEMHAADATPLLLAARLRIEQLEVQPDRGIYVMDSMVDAHTIVLALAEGSGLTLWEINVYLQSSRVVPVPHDWTRNPAMPYVDEKFVQMKLGRTDDGRVKLEVIQKGEGLHTLYEAEPGPDLKLQTVSQSKHERK